jgi:hypothetical protein
MQKIIVFASVCLLSCAAFADGLPEPVLPAGVSVNIHFSSGHERDLDLIAAAGFKWVREDLSWAATERQKGQYDWTEFDVFTTDLQKHGLRAYYILDYSNPLYEESEVSTNPVTGRRERALASPQHPESVAAFAHWAAAAAQHFSGRGVIWEIWNEPNIFFWKPHPDVAQYTTLALATAKAIRAADPQACIVGPASSTFPWRFLENVCKSGLLDYLDAVSVHPYRGKLPETAAADFARLRKLIKQYAPQGKDIPILSGEWGYATDTKGVSPDTQAAYLARQQLSNLLNGVPLSIWYDWKNDGPNPADRESNFGTVDNDLNPKPAYEATQVLTRELSGYRIAYRRVTDDTNDFVLVLTNNVGQTKLAAWTLSHPHSISVDSVSSVPLDAMPKYIARKN